MMKQIVIFSILIMLVATQTTVNPKTQGCACSNLLSQADCQAKSGCLWTANTNSTNSTSSTNTSSTSTTSGGTCGTQVTTTVTYTTYCGPLNSTICPQTLGCAWLNNTCQIFTGCTAYVNTTNALCQGISTQCTTDTTKCIPIAQCSTYTKSQQQCEGNVGSIQPYKCKWTASGTTGTCAEQTCKDAPTTYTTLKQCQSWISNCLSTGAGCDTSLGTCSTYKVSDNCVGRIGSDGNCGTPTDAAATTCVARQCSDAPKTASYNTDAACVAFQPQKTCVTTQKGCVDSPLPQCSTFKKTDGCTDFKGSDGWCTDDTTANSTVCRPLKCSDASFTTNDACKTAIKGLTCTSNGLTCTDALLACEQYNDTNSNCLNYIGTNGKCKGTSATETAKASCAARVCKEASNTLKDDVSCGNYKSGCITTGAGCIDVLGACSSYTGTTTTCAQYKGNDGNCFAPTTQTTDGLCQPRLCSAADTTFNTNTQCQNYSYLCYTNGKGCTTLTTCEDAQLATTCSGNSQCSSVNNLCLGLSDCSNFKNQSQCLINNQIYKPSGSTTTYSRKCSWASSTCSNIACSDIVSKLSATQSDLKDDATCKAKLDGCLFGGAAAGGCVDVNDDCTKYTGTLTTCQNYKGSQGKDQCINTTTNASTPAACTKKVCTSAKTQSTSTFSQQSDCTAFISSGCNFDGKDNCTDGDCSSYYNTDCTKVTTAKTASGTALQCVNDTVAGGNKCKNKTCADATPNATTFFNTDSLCNAWLPGCVTDGTKCVDPLNTQCSTYKGTQDQCSKFNFKPSSTATQSCTKLTKICQAFSTCTAHLIPQQLTSTNDKSLDCQLVVESTDSQNCIYDSAAGKCANPSTCDKYVTTLSGAQAQQYCYNLNIKTKSCWWSTGNTCAVVTTCADFTILSGTSDKDAATLCQKSTYDDTTYCGFISAATKCSAKSCSDFGIGATQASDCTSYLATCDGYSSLGFCYTLKLTCDLYTFDASYNTSLKKAQYCSSLIDKTSGTALKCTYDQKTDKCLAADDCTKVTFASSSVPADSEKQDVCVNAQDKTGNKCGFTAAGTACIAIQTNCNGYAPIGGTTDADRQTSCQKFVNAAGETCNYKTGDTTKCVDYAQPNAFSACTGYMTYQATDADNLKYCSKLVASTGGPKCGYSSTTAGSCKTFACSDLTSTNCSSYSSLCFYSGISCIGLQTTCAGYTIEATATDKTAYCKQLTGSTGSKKCAYNSATSTTKCSERACADLTTSDSYKTCSDYLSTCLFDGTKCVDSFDCTTITPTGTTDSDKASFCNKLGDGKKCTFVGGGSKCVTTLADCTYTISTLPFAYAQAACSIAQDSSNKKCGYSTGTKCEARSCINAVTASTTQNCIDWVSGCELDSANTCAAKNCNDAPITATTDTLCGQWKSGCLTTLKGCIDSTQPCSSYFGDASQCQQFTGNNIKCNNNKATPTTSDACVDKTCTDNTVALTNADCDTWYPSKCVWNGTKGCWDNTKTCAQFQGTVDSCKIYKAQDGPCSGTGLGTTLAACYSNNICTNAPTSTKTDADCKTWHSNCITNGFGCIPKTSKCTDIVDPTVCAASALSCSSTGNSCVTKPASCSSFTTASDCNNLLLAGATIVSCGWDATKASSNCVTLTCELLPASLTTDSQCAAKLTQGTCTTSGAGCVTKDFCSNYKTQTICQNAKSKDTQGSCTWENSSCRPIKCEDKTVGATDDVCSTYLTGCRTNGVGCVTPTALTCSGLARLVCQKDGSGNPCYWFSGSCQSYIACTSLVFTSHSTCQSYSTSCTTDGTKCIAIDKCASLQKPSCFVGTDNGGSICGWGQTTGQTTSQCQVFSNCGAFSGTTNVDCASWGSKCITDGTKCIDTANCASYLTQTACGNQGLDGRCQWVAATGTTGTGTCRLRQCTDALASDTTLTTFAGCQSYTINSSTKCNTDGKQCITLGACSSNLVQAACQSGTDGDCFWGLPLSSSGTNSTNSTNSTSSTSPTTISSICRLKVCTDLALTSSSSCSVAISKVDCVSDGTKCIPKSTCSSYTTREACAGKGTDGVCAFTPANSTTPTVGTCKIFSQCSDANSDSLACNSNPSCNFVTNGTSTTCSTHTCATKAQGSTCYPFVSSFADLSTYQICVLSGTSCVAGNANTFTSSLCYDKSVNTYTWNPTSQTCQACNQTITNNTGNNNNTNNSNNTYGYLLSILVLAAFMF